MSPKITLHGGPSNAREADVSPVADASLPQDVAEDVLGRQTSDEQEPAQVAEDVPEVSQEDEAPDYEGMTLAELREEASRRKIPSYGSKAHLIERLREAETESSDDAEDEAE